MSESILVPLDGTEFANRAAPWAMALARAMEADVELIRVLPASDPQGGPAGSAGAVADGTAAGEAALDLSEVALSAPTGTTVGVHVAEGPVAETIAARATERDVSLIVMASHSRGELSRALLGSVAGAVIRQSGRPVLVIPPRVPEPSHLPTRVLVPLDGSDLAASVLLRNADLARRLEWTIVLLTVVPAPPPTLPVQGAEIPLGRVPEALPPDVFENVERVAADLRRQGIATETVIGSGDRGQAIVDQAEESRCGLIAMSTHGRRGLGRWALGSVTDAVIRSASVPVLVVRPAEVLPAPAPSLGMAAGVSDGQPRTVRVAFTALQARAARLGLEYLAWSATRDEKALDDIRGALQALDEAAEQVE